MAPRVCCLLQGSAAKELIVLWKRVIGFYWALNGMKSEVGQCWRPRVFVKPEPVGIQWGLSYKMTLKQTSFFCFQWWYSSLFIWNTSQPTIQVAVTFSMTEVLVTIRTEIIIAFQNTLLWMLLNSSDSFFFKWNSVSLLLKLTGYQSSALQSLFMNKSSSVLCLLVYLYKHEPPSWIRLASNLCCQE